jgi:hypothetical protein
MSQLEATLRTCLGYREAFRRVGYEADEIYLVVDAEQIGVMVVRGPSSLGFCAGPRADATRAQVSERWTQLADWWNVSSSVAEREELWNAWKDTLSVPFVAHLVQRGMLPSSETDTAVGVLQ